MAEPPLLGNPTGTVTAQRTARALGTAAMSALAAAAAASLVMLGLVGARYPTIISSGLLAFSFGLRHAVDADHIAAIDNVSRKLIADGQPSLLLGLWFSLGHSTIVFVLCAAVALSSSYLSHHLTALQRWGGILGTTVSATVLLLIAAVNTSVALQLKGEWRQLAQARTLGVGAPSMVTHRNHDGSLGTHTHVVEVEVAESGAQVAVNPSSSSGLLLRCCPRVLGVVDRGWKMYFVGFLFGLGFDTATEVALLGLTSVRSEMNEPPLLIMLLPCLFASAMALIDTADGVMMHYAYQFALREPSRRIFFNFFLTTTSAVIALVVACLEILGCLQQSLQLSGGIWDTVTRINDHFEWIGFGVMAVFALSTLVAVAIFKCSLQGQTDIQIPLLPQSSPEAEAGCSVESNENDVDEYLRMRMLRQALGQEPTVSRVEI